MTTEPLARIVFERTPQGVAAMKAADTANVPKPLRTLLLAVDGRTPVAQFVPFLTALAPLSDKFSALERLGLVRRKGQVSADAVDRFSRAQQDLPGTALLPRIDASAPGSDYVPLDDAMLTRIETSFAPAAVPGQPSLAAFDAELEALKRMMSAPSASPPRAAPVAGPPRAAPVAGPARVAPQRAKAAPASLSDVIAEISSFLAAAVGMDGLPVALLIEQIGSIDQMRRELPGYAQMLASYGVEAGAHLERIETMLASAR